MNHTSQFHRSTTDSNWLANAIRKRYSIAMILFLSFWSFAGFIQGLEPILTNALLLDSYMQLVVLTSINLIAIVFAIASIRLFNFRFPGHYFTRVFGDGSKRWGWQQLVLASLLAAITPVVLGLRFSSELPSLFGPPQRSSMLFVAIGIAVGWVLFLGLGPSKRFLFGWLPLELKVGSGDYFPFEIAHTRDGQIGNERYFGLDGSDFQLAMYMFVVILIHWFSSWGFRNE